MFIMNLFYFMNAFFIIRITVIDTLVQFQTTEEKQTIFADFFFFFANRTIPHFIYITATNTFSRFVGGAFSH